VSKEEAWLLVENQEDETKAWLCWGLDEWCLENISRVRARAVAGRAASQGCEASAGDRSVRGSNVEGANHHVSAVLLTYSFLMSERAAQSAAARLPLFSQIVRVVIHEMAVRTGEKEGVDRETAERVAEAMHRGLLTGDQPLK
jgi:hypothetical protein